MPSPIAFHREALPPLVRLEAEWRGLEEIASPSFFTSWRWIGSWLGALPEECRPTVLRGSAEGRTVALALLGAARMRRHRVIRSRAFLINETGDPRFDCATIEHNGLLTADGWESQAAAALIAWFRAHRAEADELRLGGSMKALPEATIAAAGLWSRQIVRPSYAVDLAQLGDSSGDIAAVLSRNARQQLRRAMRRFERGGPLRLRAAQSLQEAYQFFAALKALHIASWERRSKRHAFTEPFFEDFHRRLIAQNIGEGGIELLRIDAGERVLGYLYNLRIGGHVYAYQSGFVAAGRGEHPGTVAHALAIRRAFESGAQIYDFMAGYNRLKDSFVTSCAPMLWQVIQQPRLICRAERLARCMVTIGGRAART